jgi:hypothetical protein
MPVTVDVFMRGPRLRHELQNSRRPRVTYIAYVDRIDGMFSPVGPLLT